MPDMVTVKLEGLVVEEVWDYRVHLYSSQSFLTSYVSKNPVFDLKVGDMLKMSHIIRYHNQLVM